MSDPSARTCPFCAETISAAAKVCPHCQQWLALRSLRHPLIQTLLYVVPFLMFWAGIRLVIIAHIEKLTNPKPFYSEFADSLRVREARMRFVETYRGPRIWIVGMVTNTSPIAWRSAEFDCRFYDAAGTLVDAGTGTGLFTILPHSDAAFRISLEPIAPTNAYGSFSVSVSYARNAKGWF